MKRNIKYIFFMLFFCLSILSFAQENEPKTEEPAQENPSVFAGVTRSGDQSIQLAANLTIPFSPSKLNLGGSGALSYTYFFTDWFGVGANVGFNYLPTLGSNTFYFIPILARTVFQLSIGRFEIPFSLGIGGAVQAYVDKNYFGLCIKPELAGFFRINSNWSAGIAAGLFILPQWDNNPVNNRTGLIMDVGLTARYHF